MKLPKTLTALTLFVASLTAKAATKLFSANHYGAMANSTALNTVAIQRAISEAAKSHGTVIFAPGTCLTGSSLLRPE